MPPTLHRNANDRIAFFNEIIITESSIEEPLSAHPRDISLGGVGLVSPRAVSVGQFVTLTFRIESRVGDAGENFDGRVANVWFDQEAWILGLNFSWIRSFEEDCKEMRIRKFIRPRMRPVDTDENRELGCTGIQWQRPGMFESHPELLVGSSFVRFDR